MVRVGDPPRSEPLPNGLLYLLGLLREHPHSMVLRKWAEEFAKSERTQLVGPLRDAGWNPGEVANALRLTHREVINAAKRGRYR